MKKILSLALICVVLINLPIKVNAKEYFDGDLTIEEGARPFIIDVEENERVLAENYKLLAEYKKISQKSLARGLDYNTLSITCFQQERGYYCGPATVKQVVHFLNGSSNTQDYYANQLGTTTDGTDMTRIPTVLKNATGVSYALDSIGTQSSWFDKIFVSVMNSKPAILDINTSGISAFPYSSRGHFVNVSGYNAAGNKQVRITDPYVLGLGNRWYDEDDLYAANNNHFRKSIIW